MLRTLQVSYARYFPLSIKHAKRVGVNFTRIERHYGKGLRISPEVKQALAEKTPVVALESTIITHRFAYPDNVDMLNNVESRIRANGCVPATCAFVKGIPYVGLNQDQIEYLASQSGVIKVSRVDIGPTMALKLDGGTTLAGTMILARKAGVQVLATSGLSGVHRDGHITTDLCADLIELGRTPMCVVCSGPRVILNVPKTMEYLETHGVLVGTYTDGEKGRIPGFYRRDSGVDPLYTFDDWAQIASVIYNHNTVMGLSSGSLVCVPPPKDSATRNEYPDEIIESADEEAFSRGIEGKELTSFLLDKIADDTQGLSVNFNKDLVVNNAVASCKIAQELINLINEDPTPVFPPNTPSPSNTKISSTAKESKGQVKSKSETLSKAESNLASTLFIGLLAQDTICSISGSVAMKESNPGKFSSLLGSVGFNIALDHGYSMQSQKFDPNSRLVSAVGADIVGHGLLDHLIKLNIDTSGIKVLSECKTAQYLASLDSSGHLLLAIADMKIFESSRLVSHVEAEILRAEPKVIVVDCNLLAEGLDAVLGAATALKVRPRVIVGPTSAPKLSRLVQVNSDKLKVFPNNIVSLVTPTVEELSQIHNSFAKKDFFDDYEIWFPLLDLMGIGLQFREKLATLSLKSPAIKYVLEKGVVQQAVQLLPYIPNILIKMGSLGCLFVALSTNVNDYKSIPTVSRFKPTFTLISKGANYDEGKTLGVTIEYFAAPVENSNLSILHTTGVSNTLLGNLASLITKHDWLANEVKLLEQEWGKWEGIYKSQITSGKTIQSADAVSKGICST